MSAPLIEVGAKYPTKLNGDLVVISYEGCTKVLVKFTDTSGVRYTTTSAIRRGEVRDHCRPNVYGKGYFGYGKYKSKIDGKHTKNYSRWRSMIQRCYGDYDLPTYKGVIVCEEWLNFQVFSDWFFDTYPDQGVDMELDKDVLGGKVYSPDTCVWLTPKLNSILTERAGDRGEYPLGVTLIKGRFASQLSIGNGKGSYTIGTYDCPYEAFFSYKYAKESYIESEAEKVKHLLSDRAFNGLLSYEIVDDSPWKAHLHRT